LYRWTIKRKYYAGKIDLRTSDCEENKEEDVSFALIPARINTAFKPSNLPCTYFFKMDLKANLRFTFYRYIYRLKREQNSIEQLAIEQLYNTLNMYRKTLRLFAFLFLLGPVLTGLDVKAQLLTIVTADGTETTDSLTWLECFTFPGDQLYVSYRDNSAFSYNLTDIKVIRIDAGPLGSEDASIYGTTEGITLYPNPAENEFSVKNLPDEGASIMVYRIDGKLVLQQEVYSEYETINIEDLERGLYLVKIGEQTIRLIRL